MGLPIEVWRQLLHGDEGGVRLEMQDGLPIWEAMPGVRHQETVMKIYGTVERIPGHPGDCGCFKVPDCYIKFGDDNSFKRPDISIFCTRPPEVEGATSTIPKAVIEVISKGYEKKDLELGPPFYLAHGVLDVLVLNPYTERVHHFSKLGESQFVSPKALELECGCRCIV